MDTSECVMPDAWAYEYDMNTSEIRHARWLEMPHASVKYALAKCDVFDECTYTYDRVTRPKCDMLDGRT